MSLRLASVDVRVEVQLRSVVVELNDAPRKILRVEQKYAAPFLQPLVVRLAEPAQLRWTLYGGLALNVCSELLENTPGNGPKLDLADQA